MVRIPMGTTPAAMNPAHPSGGRSSAGTVQRYKRKALETCDLLGELGQLTYTLQAAGVSLACVGARRKPPACRPAHTSEAPTATSTWCIRLIVRLPLVQWQRALARGHRESQPERYLRSAAQRPALLGGEHLAPGKTQ